VSSPQETPTITGERGDGGRVCGAKCADDWHQGKLTGMAHANSIELRRVVHVDEDQL
jgi:hypothetical protein